MHIAGVVTSTVEGCSPLKVGLLVSRLLTAVIYCSQEPLQLRFIGTCCHCIPPMPIQPPCTKQAFTVSNKLYLVIYVNSSLSFSHTHTHTHSSICKHSLEGEEETVPMLTESSQASSVSVTVNTYTYVRCFRSWFCCKKWMTQNLKYMQEFIFSHCLHYLSNVLAQFCAFLPA